ncbi:MAG: sigma-70 family RNA polymerase sigma factor [Anaerolineales bacterium]
MKEAIVNFEEIHETYRPKIERYLTRMVGEAEAEDLTQEVFVKIHRGLGGFKGDSALSTWVYRIATNTALDALRSPTFRRTVENLPLTEDADPCVEALASPDSRIAPDETSPEREVFKSERYECYRGVLRELPPNYRAVVGFSELGELAVGEIAAILGLNLSTVKMRLHRGRERLLRELKAHCRAEDWL